MLRRRLERIGATLPKPKSRVPPLNLAALTAAEVAEVEALAARCPRDPGGRRFGDRWDPDALSDAELGRLGELMQGPRVVGAARGRQRWTAISRVNYLDGVSPRQTHDPAGLVVVPTDRNPPRKARLEGPPTKRPTRTIHVAPTVFLTCKRLPLLVVSAGLGRASAVAEPAFSRRWYAWMGD